MNVTLTAHSEFIPVPAVEIRIGEDLDEESADSFVDVTVPDGTDSITVWWSSQDRSDKVAGAVRRGFSGEFGHLDVEAGFDVPTSYELECFVDGVAVGRISIGTVTLPWAGDPLDCLIQQPLDPNLFAIVSNLAGSWPTLTWDAPGELVGTQGAVFPSLVGFGPRGGATGVAVDFGAPTRQVSERVRATLGTQAVPQLPVWLIRSHHGFLPRRFYAHVQSIQEVDVNLRMAGTWSRFLSTVTEIARPAPGLLIAPLSYDDLDVSYDDYDDRDAAYVSYDAMDTDWSLAGAAG